MCQGRIGTFLQCDQDFFLVSLIDSHVFLGVTGLGWVGSYLPIVVNFFRHLQGYMVGEERRCLQEAEFELFRVVFFSYDRLCHIDTL